MAVKTFAVSSVLTASDTNTYLANSGSTYVSGGTIGSAVSSVASGTVFTSTYDAYRIVVSGGAASANGFVKMTLGASITGYYQVRNGIIFSTGARNDGVDNNAAAWTAVGVSRTDGLAAEITLVSPALAKWTWCRAWYGSDTAAADVVGVHQVATAYSSFTISPSTGTWTGGTWAVYGVRMP